MLIVYYVTKKSESTGKIENQTRNGLQNSLQEWTSAAYDSQWKKIINNESLTIYNVSYSGINLPNWSFKKCICKNGTMRVEGQTKPFISEVN